MTAFFQNIWAWITSHADIIAGVLTPANLILVIGALVQVFRQKKTIVANTNITGDLNKALKENKVLQDIKERNKEIEALRAQVGDIADQMTQAITKLNAVLEVQESAYNASSLPKETLVTIHNLIASGKFAESKARVAVNEEMAALRAKIEELVQAGEKSEEKIKKLTNAAPKQPAQGVRL